jgi:hypothetical protein
VASWAPVRPPPAMTTNIERVSGISGALRGR